MDVSYGGDSNSNFDMEFTFSSVGDLSDEIAGTEILKKASQEENVAPNDLSEAFAQRVDGHMEVIANNDIPGVSDSKIMDERAIRNKEATLLKTKRLLMAGADPLVALKNLAIDFTQKEAKESSEIKEIVNNAGLLGTVYMDRTAYPTLSCDSLGEDISKNKNKTANYIKKSEKCASCNYSLQGKCQKFAMNLVDEMNYTPEIFEEYSKKLAGIGKIASSQKIDSRESLKEACLNTMETPERVYPFSKKEAAPIDLDHALKMTKEAVSEKKAKQDEAVAQVNFNREVAPMLRHASETILKGGTKQTLKVAITEKQYTEAQLEGCKSKLAEIVNSPASWSRLAVDMSLYEDSCEQAKKFLQDNHLSQVRYAMEGKKCFASCNRNIEGTCSLTGCKIIKEASEISLADRCGVIDNVQMKNAISSEAAEDYKAMEKEAAFSGVKAALEALATPKGTRVAVDTVMAAYPASRSTEAQEASKYADLKFKEKQSIKLASSNSEIPVDKDSSEILDIFDGTPGFGSTDFTIDVNQNKKAPIDIEIGQLGSSIDINF